MQSPPLLRYLVPPKFKYSPQHHVLKHPQLPFLPQCQRPSFTPIIYICKPSMEWDRRKWFLARVTVKQSHYKPGQTLMVPGGWDSQISKQSTYEDGKDVSPTHRPPLISKTFLLLISVGTWVNPRALGRSEEYVNEKLQWHHWELNPGSSTCSAVPQPTVPPRTPFFQRVRYTFPQRTQFRKNCCERETFTISLTLKVWKKDQ